MENLKLTTLLTLVLISSACSKLDKLDKMAETTEEMKDTTKEMAATTAQMSVKTNELGMNTGYTYSDLRQGNTYLSRKAALEEMQEAQTLENKIFHAGVYFMGFEYQLWKNSGVDQSEEKLNHLKYDAIIEFTRELSEHIDSAFTIDPSSENPSLKMINAFAVALHKTNYSQNEVEHFGVKPLSMLNLFEEVIEKEFQIRNGQTKTEEQPEYILEALRNGNLKKISYLLQVRQNILPAIVLSKVSDIKDSTGWKPDFLKKILMTTQPWNPDLSRLQTDVEVSDYTRYLKESMRLQMLLAKNGHTPIKHDGLSQIYKKMNTNLSLLGEYNSNLAIGEDSKQNRLKLLGEFLKFSEVYKNSL